MGALDPAKPEDPSECPPSAAPAPPLSVDFHENPVRATQVSQGANAGREPQHFMVPMGKHGHVLSAQPIVEEAWHIRSIRRPSHKKPPNLCCRVHLHSVCLLAPNSPAPLTCISLVSAGVRRLDPLRTTLRGFLLESVQYFIQLYQTEKWTL